MEPKIDKKRALLLNDLLRKSKYDIEYFDEFLTWYSHDLICVDYLYKNLKPDNYIKFWKIIEDKYLKIYDNLFLVAFEWYAGSCMWRFPFPGSENMGWLHQDMKYHFNFSDELIKEIKKWLDDCDYNASPWDPIDTFDYDKHDFEGIELAKKIKLHLGEKIYIEYNKFKEIKIKDNVAYEEDIIPEIKQLLNITD